MKGFVLGFLVASLLFGGYRWWETRDAGEDGLAVLTPDAGARVAKKRRRSRGASRAVARPSGAGPADEVVEPEPIKLSAADLRMTGQGDNLSRPSVVRMDLREGGEERELSQDDIDAQFRAREDAILDCIAGSRPDPEVHVPGRVTIKFRIQRSGVVQGVRVEAPAVLQRGGLYGCVKGVVGGLRFPPSGSGQIVSYPFSLS